MRRNANNASLDTHKTSKPGLAAPGHMSPNPSAVPSAQIAVRTPAISLVTICLLFFLNQPVQADGVACGDALRQLQAYAVQVNAITYAEYNQNIPIRCAFNPYCLQLGLAQLSAWYMQQSSLVNNWYMQVVAQYEGSTPPAVPIQQQTQESPGRINVDAIKEITVDDEDKTARIKIPDTPQGFKR